MAKASWPACQWCCARHAGYVTCVMLMLQGLAAAAARGDITISDLLTFSSVCGCGLDTVPVPGPSSSSNGTALQGDCEAGASSIRTCDAGLCKSIAAVILDVVTLAHRCVVMWRCVIISLLYRICGTMSWQPCAHLHMMYASCVCIEPQALCIAPYMLHAAEHACRATAIMLYVCNGGLKEGPTHADCELGQQ